MGDLDPGEGKREGAAGNAFAGSVLPFLLVAYLSLKAGGYDAIVRSEVGVAIWWIVLVGASVGVISTTRINRSGWSFLGLLAAFAVWTGLGAAIWTESAERSVTELSRVVTLMGVFVFALTTQGRDFLRQAAGSTAAGITLVGLLALMSRLHPSWFPANEVSEVLPTEQSRLSYPLTYWNGVATLIAIGIPLLLWLATAARRTTTRALATAALPALILAGYFTLSRGGLGEAAVGVVVLIALHPRRLSLVPPLVLGAGGAAMLVLAASHRDELGDGLLTDAAYDQGTEMLAVTLAICAVVALFAGYLQSGLNRGVLRMPTINRRVAVRATLGVAIAALVIAIAIGLPGKASSAWNDFKQPVTPAGDAERFTSASGSGRYQWWESSIEAGGDNPLTGIGPGTFEYWWARGDGGIPGFVRDAHSLYLENLAELGLPGLLLILALVGGIVGTGVSRSLRNRSDPERAALLAAATASTATFAIAAAVDWSWELTVLPVIFLWLGAGLISAESTPEGDSAPRRPGSGRVALVALSIAALVIVAVPMLSAKGVIRSQDQVAQGELLEALESAQNAGDLLPFAATPDLQAALVLEIGGDLPRALEAAQEATQDESTNWRTWLVLSRVAAEVDNVEASIDAFRKARSLNPRSPIFSGQPST